MATDVKDGIKLFPVKYHDNLSRSDSYAMKLRKIRESTHFQIPKLQKTCQLEVVTVM